LNITRTFRGTRLRGCQAHRDRHQGCRGQAPHLPVDSSRRVGSRRRDQMRITARPWSSNCRWSASRQRMKIRN